MHTSLLHGWLPPTVTTLAFASLAFGVAWRRRTLLHWSIIATAAAVVAITIARFVDIPSQVGSGYPRSFLVWVGLPFFALGAAVWQWPRVTWWRRAVAFAAVPLFVAFGGLQVNAHYGYLPTLGDLLGAPLPGQVDARMLERSPVRLSHLTGTHRHGMDRVPAYAPLAPAPAPSPALPAAAYTIGLVARVDIPSRVSHFAARMGYVWLPPWYFTHPYAQLPVLMLIAGTPGTTADWLRGGGALRVAATYAQQHRGYAPMLVFPDANGSDFGDTECVNGPAGQAETYLTVDVPAFMRAHFNAPTDPRQWAIGGLSEGGTCALDLVARHADHFRTFADFSGDAAPNLGSVRRTATLLYGGSWSELLAHDPTRWFPVDAARGVAGYIAVGTGDGGRVRVAEQLATTARNDNLPVALDLIPGGGHNFPTWSRALSDAFPWIVQRLSHGSSAASRSV